MIRGCRYRLKTATQAIMSKDGQEVGVMIPARAIVQVVIVPKDGRLSCRCRVERQDPDDVPPRIFTSAENKWRSLVRRICERLAPCENVKY
jgi:hypothetical protein